MPSPRTKSRPRLALHTGSADNQSPPLPTRQGCHMNKLQTPAKSMPLSRLKHVSFPSPSSMCESLLSIVCQPQIRHISTIPCVFRSLVVRQFQIFDRELV